MTLASSTLRRPLAASCFVTKLAELDSFLFATGDRVTVLGAVSWEQDPDPLSAGKGYRDAAKRVVLSALPEGSLLASDKSDVLQDP
ncbi:hypothetical protein WME99_48995 [Sorangium sp. So ce136]|uniref:hypothetical protein n=1 Tax=Sorangium sp. So ce136 TaxID=3133284 RepID=UPI003F047FAD